MSLKKIWIGEMLHRVETAMRKEFGYGDSSMLAYRTAFKEIERYFIQKNEGYYLPKVGEQMIREKAADCSAGNYKREKLGQVRRICLFLEQHYESGHLTIVYFPRLGQENNPFFVSIIDWYVELLNKYNNYAPRTIINRRQTVARFLLFLEKRGHQNFETVDASDIRAYLPEIAKRQPKSLSHTLPHIQKFCHALKNERIYEQRWGEILDVKPPTPRVMRTAFTKYEIARILKASNVNTPLGMRDTAMMLLAANTGLRGVDIVNLRMCDIDWQNNELTIIQHKTGKAISLPLFAEAGNAIAQYILNGRPNIENEYIFLSANPPYKKLEANGTGIIQKYMRKAGYTKKQRFQKGFHSFRRSVGTQLLKAEIPLETISQILGHSSTEATRPYLGVDMTHLKECALDLSVFQCLRGELC